MELETIFLLYAYFIVMAVLGILILEQAIYIIIGVFKRVRSKL